MDRKRVDQGLKNGFDSLRKTESEHKCPTSTGFIGLNYGYPECAYKKRRDIIQQHRDYQQGWLYFLTNDPRVPLAVRKEMQQWVLPKDEFLEKWRLVTPTLDS